MEYLIKINTCCFFFYVCEHKKKGLKIKGNQGKHHYLPSSLLFSQFCNVKVLTESNIENAWNLIMKLLKIHTFPLRGLKMSLFELKKEFLEN